jgi:hypothetical protein
MEYLEMPMNLTSMLMVGAVEMPSLEVQKGPAGAEAGGEFKKDRRIGSGTTEVALHGQSENCAQ